MPVFRVEENITLGTWEDVLNRPGYQSPVEPLKFRFRRVAAVYSFEEQSALCGVSNCQQAHRQGFLVITSDEKETSLCEACGQRLLGVTFSSQEKVLQGLARIRKQQLRLNKVLEQSDVIKTRVKEFKQRPKGANWLYQALTSFRKAAPADLLATLKTLAASETGAEESQLKGLGIFAADIREELIGKILKPLKQLEEAIEDPEADPMLASYCQWADTLEAQFARAEQLVDEGRAFFDSENLERLKSLPLSEDSARFMRSMQWSGIMAMSKRK